MAADDIAWEINQLRKDGIPTGPIEVYASFSDETEKAIQALASHFAGTHEMCDHAVPPANPEEVARLLQMWGWYWDKVAQIWRVIERP